MAGMLVLVSTVGVEVTHAGSRRSSELDYLACSRILVHAGLTKVCTEAGDFGMSGVDPLYYYP